MRELQSGYTPQAEPQTSAITSPEQSSEITEKQSEGESLAGEIINLPLGQKIDVLEHFCNPRSNNETLARYLELSTISERMFFLQTLTHHLNELLPNLRLPNDQEAIHAISERLEQLTQETADDGSFTQFRFEILNQARGKERLGSLVQFLLDTELYPPDPKNNVPGNSWFHITTINRAVLVEFLQQLVEVGKQRVSDPKDLENIRVLESTVIPLMLTRLHREMNYTEEKVIDWEDPRESLPAFVKALSENPGSDPKIGNIRSPHELANRIVRRFNPAVGTIDSRPFHLNFNRVVGTTDLPHQPLTGYMSRLIQEIAQDNRIEITITSGDNGEIVVMLPQMAAELSASKERRYVLITNIESMKDHLDNELNKTSDQSRKQELIRNSARDITLTILKHEARENDQEWLVSHQILETDSSQRTIDLEADIAFKLSKKPLPTAEEIYTDRVQNTAREIIMRHLDYSSTERGV